MKLIKEVLKQEIDEGKINWIKLENKIHAALGLVDNKFETVMVDGKKKDMKFHDSIAFPITVDGIKRSYRILKPRFVGGLHSALFCSGLQIGFYDLKNNPYFPNDGVIF